MASIKKIFSGAAVGTLLGSFAVLLYPRRNEIMEYLRNHSSDLNGLTDKAKGYGESLLKQGKQLNFRRVEYRTNYLTGGIIGLIVGVGTGLLLAPKTGKVLRGHISKAYSDLSVKSEEVIHKFKNGTHNPFTHSPTTQTKQNEVKKRKPAVKKALHK